jgi:hypothetical protein
MLRALQLDGPMDSAVLEAIEAHSINIIGVQVHRSCSCTTATHLCSPSVPTTHAGHQSHNSTHGAEYHSLGQVCCVDLPQPAHSVRLLRLLTPLPTGWHQQQMTQTHYMHHTRRQAAAANGQFKILLHGIWEQHTAICECSALHQVIPATPLMLSVSISCHPV